MPPRVTVGLLDALAKAMLSLAERCGLVIARMHFSTRRGTVGLYIHSRRAEKAARKRAKRILEIKPGTVTVYTAYLVVAIRLLVVVMHTIVPALQ